MSTEKQHNEFVVSVAGPNIDMTIVNIEEMQLYCRTRNRIANVVTMKQTYDELDKLNYCLVMNYHKAKPRVINTKERQFHDVYRVLSERYHGGLLIAECDTVSDAVSNILCNSASWLSNDVDIMICREGLAMVTEQELKRSTYLRIAADPDFDPSVFSKFEDFLQDKVMSIMICQLFVNQNLDSVRHYMDIVNEKYSKQGMADYINYSELNKQLAYNVYFDMATGKIVNVSSNVIMDFVNKMVEMKIFPIPADEIEPYVKSITV